MGKINGMIFDEFFDEWVKMVENKEKMIETHSVKEINEEEIPATGEWIVHSNSIINTYYECSKCGGTSSKNSKRFPHCDTKME